MWLEVEKNKQKRNTLLAQQDSFLMQALESPGMPRRNTSTNRLFPSRSATTTVPPRFGNQSTPNALTATRHTNTISTADVPSALVPNEGDDQEEMDNVDFFQEYESRVSKLEKAVEMLLKENKTLKEQVGSLEGLVAKQGKEIRRFKKSAVPKK